MASSTISRRNLGDHQRCTTRKTATAAIGEGPVVLCEFNPRCLRDHAGKAPLAFADMLFSIARGRIDVLHHNGTDEERFVSQDAAQLMRLWSELDAKAGIEARLSPGLLHLVLICRQPRVDPAGRQP